MSRVKYATTPSPEDYGEAYHKMSRRERSKFKQWVEHFHVPNNAVLDADQALDIITAVRSGESTMAEMASKYEVAEQTVRDTVYGRNWAARLAEAGYIDDIKWAPPKEVVPDENAAELYDLIRDSTLSMQEIADDYGMSLAKLYRFAREYNLDPKATTIKRRAYRYTRPSKVSDEVRRLIYHRVNEEGVTYKEAAAEFGLSVSYTFTIANNDTYSGD